MNEGICWGILISLLGWGFAAGWFYYRYRYCIACLKSVLFVVGKAHQRGVYFAPYDRAVIGVAIELCNRWR